MASERRAHIIGLLGGFVAGLANASFYLARNLDDTPLWDWIVRGGIQGRSPLAQHTRHHSGYRASESRWRDRIDAGITLSGLPLLGQFE